MKLEIIPNAATYYGGVKVENRDESIEFKGSGSLYCGGNDVNLFDSFNLYLDGLKIEQKDELFDLYQEAKDILEPREDVNGKLPSEELLINNQNYHFLIEKLQPIVNKIIKVLNPMNLEYFVTQNGYTQPPKDLNTNFSRGEFPKETTIDEPTYRDITRLIFILRGILPIISEMLVKAESISGKDYKEVVTGNLVKSNPFIMNHPGWKKVFEYVEFSYNAPNRSTNPLRLEIITKDSFPEHAGNKAIFCRLAFSHVPSLVPSKNLAKILHSIVKQFEEPTSKLREKTVGRDDASNKRSIYEVCLLKENVNAADEAVIAEYFAFGLLDENDRPRTKDRFKHQCIGLGIQNEKMVEYCYDLLPDVWDFELTEPMVKLMQLAFADDISYNVYFALEHYQLMPALALAQVKLHEMGYPHLAIMLTAIPNPDGLPMLGTDMFSLNMEERRAIEALCDVYQSKGETSTDNEAVSSTMDFFKSLTLNGWHSTIEIGLLSNERAMATAIRGNLYEVELVKEFKEEFLSLIQVVNEVEESVL